MQQATIPWGAVVDPARAFAKTRAHLHAQPIVGLDVKRVVKPHVKDIAIMDAMDHVITHAIGLVEIPTDNFYDETS